MSVYQFKLYYVFLMYCSKVEWIKSEGRGENSMIQLECIAFGQIYWKYGLFCWLFLSTQVLYLVQIC